MIVRKNAFLDRALPDWRYSATTLPPVFRCMAQQPPSDQQHAGFGIGGLADTFGPHYYTTILKCLQDFNVTAGGCLCAALKKLTDEVLSMKFCGDLPSVQAAYNVQNVQQTLVLAGAQQAPLPQGQTQSPGTPLLPEILSLFDSPTRVRSRGGLIYDDDDDDHDVYNSKGRRLREDEEGEESYEKRRQWPGRGG